MIRRAITRRSKEIASMSPRSRRDYYYVNAVVQSGVGLVAVLFFPFPLAGGLFGVACGFVAGYHYAVGFTNHLRLSGE